MNRNENHSDYSIIFRISLLSAFVISLIGLIEIHSRALQIPLTQTQPSQTGTAMISGVVLDDKGVPIDKATVSLTSTVYSASVLTQSDGKFEFKNLAPAKYTITVQAARLRQKQTQVTITKPDEIVPPVTIKLASAPSLHVAVFDAGNNPLGNVTVSLYTQEKGVAEEPAARSVTDKNGDAYFGKLAPGSYRLTAVLRGYDEYRNEVYISSDITTEFPIQLLVAPVIPINAKAIARYSIPNLPSKSVHAVYQDSDGWMWFGTDRGIAKFNGIDFKSSTGAGSAYANLAGDNVLSIAEDQNAYIWMATTSGIKRITREGGNERRWLEGIETRKVFVDSRGTVWVTAAAGIFKFDGKDFDTFDETRGLPANDVKGIAEDKNGKLWIATAKGIAVIDEDKVIRLDFKRDIITTPANPLTSANPQTPSNPPRNQSATSSTLPTSQTNPTPALRMADVGTIEDVFIDKSGTIWLATQKGLLTLDNNGGYEIAAALHPAQLINNLQALAINQDSSGRMWFALINGGAVIYDLARGESQRINFLEQDTVTALYNGREGDVWFATENGTVYADLYSFVNFSTSRGLPDNDARLIVEEPKAKDANNLWCLTSTGVSQMQGERFAPLESFRVKANTRCVAFDKTGAAWFATEQGVVKLDGLTLTQFSEGNGLVSNNVRWVTKIGDGSALAFATAKGATIFRDDGFHPLKDLDGYDTRHIFEDADGRLWFATSRGVMVYNQQTDSAALIDASRGLIDNDTRWITRFNGLLFIATRSGVQAYNERQQGVAAFDAFDGEPASTLFVDRDNFLWVGTDSGQVKKFHTIQGHIISTVYSGEEHSLTGNRINAISEDSEGYIWIATDKGAVRHKPIRVPPSAQAALKFEGNSGAVFNGVAYELPSGQQRATFRLTGVSMSGQLQYLYRNNPGGIESRWELLPVQSSGEREVTVFQLDEGLNTFEVIALNRDLYGAKAPAATVPVRVQAPFWKRWWFYFLMLTGLGLATGAFFVVRQRQQREYVLPKELRTFLPIEKNPYIVGNPIRSEKMFFGREDDFRYVRTKLEGASQGVLIVFCGERRVGKSSILYQVMNGRLGKRFVPVFVDMQEMVITSDGEFFARIARLIVDALQRIEVRLIAPSFANRNPYPVFTDFLDDVIAAIGDRTLLILIDEYELMESKVDEGKLSPDFFTFLAGTMDNKERLAFIFTGSRRLEERDKKYWHDLLKSSLFRKVGFLTNNDTLRLITEPIEGKVVYGRGVIDAIYRLTAGQPFYTQVTCQNIVDYLNEHEQNWVTLADLNNVTKEIVDNPLPQMIYTWDALSDDEKLVISLLSETLANGDLFATAYDLWLSVKLNQYPVNLSETTIRLTLEEMFRRELLDKNVSDGFRLRIDLFRLWIRRSHSIWQVVKEVRTL
ncbi:MAG: two-component regulator propeller domain-containing protein [Acidobacteriota bacterium]